MFKASIFENVRAARPGATREQVFSALMATQYGDILEKLPQGMDTLIGSEGTYLSGGVDISRVDPEALLTDYSMVFQDVVLFDDTVMENIRLGKRGAADQEVRAAAEAANCGEFVCRLPQGYDTPIVLLDEATASLDVENETKVQGALSRLLAGKTVLVIAHRMRTVAGADHIVVLENGHVAEQGTPAELMERGGIYRRMVKLQSENSCS